ncbi:MAG TPA: protein kinase [Kofleriaceae bacterium]|nr:protein kinase [Kofleriaceae bacterium]
MEPLGGGPCGEVYRAKVVGVAGMERQLAVKRFHPQVLATPGVSGRLSQAARTYGGLDHPRLARLAELGVAAGETFTAVEWVNGLDLARLLTMAIETGSPLPAGATLGLVSAAARAIGYAHGRGVSHFGLSPTNLIATADGDVKVTDVGILACRLPPRPSQDPSLATRISYLAPEQLIGEPVSAASDVFVLGVIAYELCAGVRPFLGANPLDLEQAVLSGRPAPLELPRPVVRVIDRCLARSPFERFPDARALADALDAALRLSPLAGGKRDIGDRVTSALEHIARMNEQQLSGALSFAVPTSPQSPPARGSLPLKPPSPTGRATVFGVPAPAPAPQRIRPPSVAPPVSQSGMRLRPGTGAPQPRLPTERTNDPTIAREEPSEGDLSVGDDTVPRIEPMWPPTEQVATLKAPQGGLPSALGLGTKTISAPPPPPPSPMRPVGSNPPPFEAGRPPVMPEGSPSPLSSHGGPPPGPPPGPGPFGPPPGPPAPPQYAGPMAPPAPEMPQHAPLAAPYPPPFAMSGTPSVRPRWQSIAMIVALVMILGAVAAGAAFLIHRSLSETTSGSTQVASGTAAGAVIDAGVTAPSPTDAAVRAVASDDADRAVVTAPIDAAAAVTADIDAAPAVDDVKPDAGSGDVVPPDPSDKLVIKSTPPGAHVYIDGAEEGKTPLTLAASSDRHTLALFLPGHDLYLAEVDGKGSHDATLTPITPPEGPGGIKVRCKAEDRYYVFLNGKPTGQLCPTERLGVDKGDHTVEVYDLVSETRKTFPAKVKKTRVSVRVRIDYD